MDTWHEVVEICGKFGLAIVLSGVIGLERQVNGHAAGLRTNIMVCLGATVMMLFSKYVASHIGTGNVDITRIAAGIITGIGFLGAGAIINVGSEQHGLTTAAMIWFVAALGIAIGAGFNVLAVCATFFALLVVVGLHYIEQRLPTFRHVYLTILMPHGLDHLCEIEGTIRQQGFYVQTSRITTKAGGGMAELVFELGANAIPKLEELAAKLRKSLPEAETISIKQ